MNYRQLLNILNSLDDEQLNQTVTMYSANIDEFFGVCSHATTKENDILENNHFYLIIKG